MSTIAATEADFDRLVGSDGIVLADFWAAWCGPCRMFAPVYEAASQRYPGITFAKVDTEAEPGLAARFGIMSIPTLMAFRDGVHLFAQPGALPAPALDDLIGKLRALDMDQVRAQIAATASAS